MKEKLVTMIVEDVLSQIEESFMTDNVLSTIRTKLDELLGFEVVVNKGDDNNSIKVYFDIEQGVKQLDIEVVPTGQV